MCSGRRRRSASRAAHTRAHWLWSEPSTPTTIPRGGAGSPPVSHAGSGCTCSRPMGSASSRFLPDVAAILPEVPAPGVHRRGDPESAARTPGFPHYSRLIANIQDGGGRGPGGRLRPKDLRRVYTPFRRPGIHGGWFLARRAETAGNPGVQPMSYLPYPRQEILGILRGVAEPRLVFQNAAPGCCGNQAEVSVRGIAPDWHHFEEDPAVSSMPLSGGIERTAAVVIGTGLSGLAVASELAAPRRRVHHCGRPRPPGRRPSGQHVLAAALRRGRRRQPEGAQRNPAAPAQLRRQPQA